MNFRDRLRTLVNVMGDGVGCGFVQAMVERNNDSYSSDSFNNTTNKTAKVAPFNNLSSAFENKSVNLFLLKLFKVLTIFRIALK